MLCEATGVLCEAAVCCVKLQSVVSVKLQSVVCEKLQSVVCVKLQSVVSVKLQSVVSVKLQIVVCVKLQSVVCVKLQSVVCVKLPVCCLSAVWWCWVQLASTSTSRQAAAGNQARLHHTIGEAIARHSAPLPAL